MFKEHQWRAIQDYVQKIMAQRGEYFTVGVVVKRDDERKLVWTSEFGDTPIPLFTFDFTVKYYDTQTTGAVKPKKTRPARGKQREVEVVTPQIGETVLIARHLGSRNLPKCIGVMQSHNFDPQGD
jgi:hypothetical protein